MEIEIKVNGFVYTADVPEYVAGNLQAFAESVVAGDAPDGIDGYGETPLPPPVAAREALLADAFNCVMQDRNASYGNPEDNFRDIANYWNSYCQQRGIMQNGSHFIVPQDVAHLMILLKMARLGKNMAHRDSLVDIAGYAACAADCQSPF